MSYRLLRFVIVVIGLAALGGFGWRFYDFLQNRAQLLGPFPLQPFLDSIEVESGGGKRVHLKPFEQYAQLRTLNVTGLVPADVGNGVDPPPPPPPVVGPNDLRLVFLSLGEVPQVYLTPAQLPPAGSTSPQVIAGGLYVVGDRFGLPSKPGVELEVLAIRADEVEIGIVGKDDGAFVLKRETATADLSQIEAGEGVEAVARQFPTETTAIGGNIYEVGTEDMSALQAMSEEQLLTSVRTAPKYGPDGKVVGQRVTGLSSNSPLKNFGLRESDVVLDVNGVPASDRAALVKRLRAMGDVDEVSVRLERLGSIRTYTYRIPPRR